MLGLSSLMAVLMKPAAPCPVHCVVQDENDDSYEEEAEAVDEYDSDFDDDVGTPFTAHCFNYS